MRIITLIIGFIFSMYVFRYAKKYKLFSKVSMKKWNHLVDEMFSYVRGMIKMLPSR